MLRANDFLELCPVSSKKCDELDICWLPHAHSAVFFLFFLNRAGETPSQGLARRSGCVSLRGNLVPNSSRGRAPLPKELAPSYDGRCVGGGKEAGGGPSYGFHKLSLFQGQVKGPETKNQDNGRVQGLYTQGK